MDSTLRRTWAEIDLDALAHNYRTLRSRMGGHARFLGVVKADAYGHGAVEVSRTLEELGAEYLAVSNLDEALELRQGGVALPILQLGLTPADQTAALPGVFRKFRGAGPAGQIFGTGAGRGVPQKVSKRLLLFSPVPVIISIITSTAAPPWGAGEQEALMVTLNDIAARLGISKSTVSKGLNNASDVSVELRRRILETAAEMGYAGQRAPKKFCIFIENMDYKDPNQFGYDSIAGFREMADHVLAEAKEGDLVITLGCGDVYKCARMILAG